MHPPHVYLHVPFCARRCSYCDFAIAVRQVVPVADYLTALECELRIRFGDSVPWSAQTLYAGGGTPSRLGPDGVHGLMDLLRGRITLEVGAEVTLEANPEDVTDAAAHAYHAAGVNRVSLGSQTFSEEALRWMRRAHGADGIHLAVERLRGAGIENISLDLIFALPGSIHRDWSADLDMALALKPDHISLYGLTIEPRTPLGRWHGRGQVAEATEATYEHDFLLASERLTAAGYVHYEVSNFGLPGRESRHNRSYWTGAAYAGLGPSAHEFNGAERRWNVNPYEEWRALAVSAVDPIGGREELTRENRVAETVYLGLRTTAGLAIEGSVERGRAEVWEAAGWATVSNGVIRLTALGWLRLDSLAADLTVIRSR